MSSVHVLDDSTINKIAAGEVVERPASVVKELVENAMDAKATRIEVEIAGGGIELMRVTDNGKGMSEEDARLAILRHATSKIQSVTDLQSIGTLGFRGEALPTISSVSRFTLLTREAGADLGTRVTISGGGEPEISEAGCALGTTIKVEDLFFNTPARKKFLKTNHTEAAHINDFIVKLALSRPDIEFHFLNNNKKTVETPGTDNLFDTIASLYGKKAAESLLAVSFEGENIRIHGYLTKPTMLKSSRAWQTYIVNGRIIQSRMIAKAIDNAYKSLIPRGGFPLAVLNIEVPQRSIDVNVHPQKAELKFEDESSVFKAIYKATLDAVRPAEGQRDLQQFAAVVEKPQAHFVPRQEPMHFVPATEPVKPASARQDFAAFQETIQQTKPQPRFAVSEYQAPGATTPAEEVFDSQTPFGSAEEASSVSGEKTFDLAGRLMPIGQVSLTYIIAQDEDGLYIIDQHAAHERILFDRFSAAADKIPSQQLLVHQILSFDTKESELILENQSLFGDLGFQLEAAGERDFRLLEVPADVPVSEAEGILREIMAGLIDMHQTTAKEIRQHVLATTACRAAIKAGEVLNLKQMELLLEELMNTPFPYTCPHGRPTILKFDSGDLAKMFKRTGFGF